MSFERIVDFALRAYPRELRESRGAEMRDTALEASGGSRAKLARESLALAGAGMSARARAVVSSVLGTSAHGTLNLRAVMYRVTRAYARAWRSLLAASALYFLTNAACDWLAEQPARQNATQVIFVIVAIVTLVARIIALAWFAAFVISRGANIESEESSGVRAALFTARSTAGETALILILGTVALAAAAYLTKALGVALGVDPSLGRVNGGIAGIGAAGALTYIAVLTMWSVALPVIVIEDLGIMRPLARSRELIRGNVLRALVVVTIVVVIAEAARLVGGDLAGAVGEIGATIVWLPVAPIPPLAATALYLELTEAPSRWGRTA